LEAFLRESWRHKTMADIAAVIQWLDNSMPCLASVFEAMSGVQKQTNVYAAINCTSSANQASNV